MIATTSHSTKAYRLRALGADAVVNYLEVPEWGERVRELTNGRGVERVVEVGGPGTIEQSLRAVAYGGEIAFMGYLSKDNPSLDFFKLKHSGAVFRNIMVGDRAGLEDLARTIEMAKIQPVIDRVFDFEAAQGRARLLRHRTACWESRHPLSARELRPAGCGMSLARTVHPISGRPAVFQSSEERFGRHSSAYRI